MFEEKKTTIESNFNLGWSLECLYDWDVYFKLGIAGYLQTLAVWSYFEVATFLSGFSSLS